MDEAKADILMKFVLDGGSGVLGESLLQSAPNDPFMAGFDPIGAYDDYSNFFEVKNFNFTVKVEPQEQRGGPLTSGQPAVAVASMRPQASQAAQAPKAAKSNDPFDRWRSATDEELKQIKYPVLFDTFSFDRYIDAASPIFFQQCANQTTFVSATLVKRVSATSGSIGLGSLAQVIQAVSGIALGGGSGGGAMASAGFLRIDFFDLMLTSLAWNDGDMVTESCSFTCKHMDIQYRKQNMDSSLTSTVSQASWDRLLNGSPNSTQES